MIILGIILIVVGYLVPGVAFVSYIGWLLLVVGLILLVIGQLGKGVGGRKHYF